MGSDSSPGPDRPLPTTIDGIVEAVLAELSEKDIRALAAQDKFDPVDHHFGLGMWVRNQFVWQNEGLLEEHAFCHPDELSSIILMKVWRRTKEL